MNWNCEACLSRKRVYGANGCNQGGTACRREEE